MIMFLRLFLFFYQFICFSLKWLPLPYLNSLSFLMDLALNNLQWLICHKTKQTKPFFLDLFLRIFPPFSDFFLLVFRPLSLFFPPLPFFVPTLSLYYSRFIPFSFSHSSFFLSSQYSFSTSVICVFSSCFPAYLSILLSFYFHFFLFSFIPPFTPCSLLSFFDFHTVSPCICG